MLKEAMIGNAMMANTIPEMIQRTNREIDSFTAE